MLLKSLRRPLMAGVVVAALGAGAVAPVTGADAKPTAQTAKAAKAKKAKKAKKRPAAYKRCGRSTSAKRLARTTTKRYRSGAKTVTKLYCDGSRRITTTHPQKPQRVVFVPAPAPAPAPAPQPQPEPTRAEPGFRLTLLHNNDGESKYKAGDSLANYGGVAHFKTVLDKLRGEADAYTDAEVRSGAMRKGTLTVSSGDNILAGLNLRASFARRDAGQGAFYDVEALRQLGYDALTIGNHEYDFGPKRLAQLISDLGEGAPFLSANTNFAGSPELQALVASGRIAKSTVVEKGGERIGVIGVSPPETPTVSSPGAVTFDGAVAAAVNAEAAALTSKGVDKIVLSSHLQNLANERTVVAQLRNVDIVISGGGDELLANMDDRLLPGNVAAVGAYPAIAKDAAGTTVPIVTTQGEYRYVGRLTALFDSEGKLTAIDDTTSGPVRVSATPADPDYAAPDAGLEATVVTPLTAYSAALAANVIGTTDVKLDGTNPSPIRDQESNLGDLVADGFRYTTNKVQAAAGKPIAQVAFSNGGGIRTSIDGGNISEKQTFDVLPFDNSMVTVTNVTPARFKQLMEHGVAFFGARASDGRFPQISGFTMTVDKTRTAQVLDANGNVTTAGQRIRDITLLDGTKIVDNGAPVGAAPTVNIATTNFTAGLSTGGAGGDGYPFHGLTIVPALRDGGFLPYQRTLLEYISDPSSSTVAGQSALGGQVTTATHPGTGRITFTP